MNFQKLITKLNNELLNAIPDGTVHFEHRNFGFEHQILFCGTCIWDSIFDREKFTNAEFELFLREGANIICNNIKKLNIFDSQKSDDSNQQNVNLLIEKILLTDVGFYLNGSTGEWSCPFCDAFKTTQDMNKSVEMDELKHDNDCAYLLAIDLNKKIC